MYIYSGELFFFLIKWKCIVVCVLLIIDWMLKQILYFFIKLILFNFYFGEDSEYSIVDIIDCRVDKC